MFIILTHRIICKFAMSLCSEISRLGPPLYLLLSSVFVYPWRLSSQFLGRTITRELDI
jgi:hypothetical protein